MMGRRSAALLCVLLAHALIVLLLMRLSGPQQRLLVERRWDTAPIYVPARRPTPATAPEPAAPAEIVPFRVPAPVMPEIAALDAPAEPATAASTAPTDVDWPLEGQRAAKRVLDAEEEAERVAKMFSGPKGTWASLTPRERSEVRKFRWKKGVVPERDEHGNTIVHISEGCVLVNFSFIGCALGKKPVYGDLFKDMRLYFDEQRRPESQNGNGR
jgi:hypothetical protein